MKEIFLKFYLKANAEILHNGKININFNFNKVSIVVTLEPQPIRIELKLKHGSMHK